MSIKSYYVGVPNILNICNNIYLLSYPLNKTSPVSNSYNTHPALQISGATP